MIALLPDPFVKCSDNCRCHDASEWEEVDMAAGKLIKIGRWKLIISSVLSCFCDVYHFAFFNFSRDNQLHNNKRREI